MIGRNDPCPCRSGKKYKKCCAGKDEAPLEALIDEELERIVLGAYEQTTSPADMSEFESYRRHWKSKLGKLVGPDDIEEAVSEYFLFIARQDLWKRHLLRTLNNPLRSKVRSVLELWKNPIVLFGKVKEEQEDYVVVQEILGKASYKLEKKQEMLLEEHAFIFGVVLPDNRNQENDIYVISSLMFINDRNGSFEKQIIELAESSGFANSLEFYKKHMADIYEILLARDSRTVNELIEHDFTPVQQEVIEILDKMLELRNTRQEARELLRNIVVTYFLREQPNFRKPGVIAAAVFFVAVDLGMVEDEKMPNVEIAKLFDVSTGSMTKHADKIREFIMEIYEQSRNKTVE
ncbi:SEC-C metal-binding domain-containing protein [Sporosarcina sp. JAI121]|uniref:SEC-C metal-binding domain-containing protein n=1 Tax=Sporosarcina sp. JAI121 TaxID=2723064 RepID=UPI0015CB4A40|nr:SEC-C metal-binding domain-containing protein [Sporosarcina sp. JAI121]NYF23363.1 hypothetical protein [Sporosarcina sp. JAI121]